MNVVVDQLGLAVTGILADQVRTAELVIAMDERDRATEFGRHVEGQRRLAGARRTGKMHRVTDFQIGKRPLGQGLNMRSGHELIAGLGLDVVPVRLHPHDRFPKVFAECISHWKIIPLTQGRYFAILSLLGHDLAPPPLLSSV